MEPRIKKSIANAEDPIMTRKTTTIIGLAVALLLVIGIGLFRVPAVQMYEACGHHHAELVSDVV